MKNLLRIAVLSLIVTGCQQEKAHDVYISKVEGKAGDSYKNKEIFLQYIYNDSLYTEPITVDTNGKYQIFLDSIAPPTEAILINDTTNLAPKVKPKFQFIHKFTFQFGSGSVPVQYGKEVDYRPFIIEKDQITINIEDSLYNSQIENSQLNKDLDKLSKSLNPVFKEYNAHQKKVIEVSEVEDFKILDSLSKAYEDIWLKRKEAYSNYILDNPNSEASLFALKYRDGGMNTDILRLYQTLSDSVKSSEYGKFMKRQASHYSKKLNNEPNQNEVVPNFKLKNVDKEEIALYDIKSKYILLDFWASWCGPCRTENRRIIEYYNTFDRSDFQIVAVSVDDNENKWKKAIIDDNANWVSLWDVDKEVNDTFGVVSYPTNFLLNDRYEVVATQLDAEELQEKLIELLE